MSGAGTTYSAPSVAANGGGVNIVTEGPGNSLEFYWAMNGTSTWHPETVAGAATTYSAPTVIGNGGRADVVAEGPGNVLDFYWQTNGSPIWNPETVPDTSVASAPAITPDGIGVKVVAQGVLNTLGTSTDTSGIWQTTDVTHGTGIFNGWGIADAPPTVTMNNGSENIATFGANGNLYFYWQNSAGAFQQELVAPASIN